MTFFKRHKKLSITIGLILLVLVIFVILMFTLFSLKSVEINFLTSTNYITKEMEEDIISEVDLGGTVLFKNKEKLLKTIEYKYPYVKLINIETVFPNKFVLNIAEREVIYTLKSGEESISVDSDLKIIEKNSSNEAIDLSIFDLEYDFSKMSIGQILEFKDLNHGSEIEEILKNFSIMCSKNNKNISDVNAIFGSMNLSLYNDYRDGETHINISLYDRNGFEINIFSPLEHFENKVYKMFYAYSDICANYPEKLNTSRLIVYTNAKGQDCVLSEEF